MPFAFMFWLSSLDPTHIIDGKSLLRERESRESFTVNSLKSASLMIFAKISFICISIDGPCVNNHLVAETNESTGQQKLVRLKDQ